VINFGLSWKIFTSYIPYLILSSASFENESKKRWSRLRRDGPCSGPVGGSFDFSISFGFGQVFTIKKIAVNIEEKWYLS
jgi:hypothetical protein